MNGRLIGVTGPSGVGKDTIMQGIAATAPHFGLVRRTITRAPGLGGEDYEAVSDAEFDARRDAGGFVVHWQAHGLRYGIPEATVARIGRGEKLLVNLSRSVLHDVAARFGTFTVLCITAQPETLARRLTGRGRETTADIARRLSRPTPALPDGLAVITISNDGAPEDTVREALHLLAQGSAP
ncbi:phosphonate metabolism protein/1,5-bisphosphokinase (PRPP-forming) PhnN [Roseobacter ponti]|uniref:phosphonate metabolism protein/1,5-bisphosphokinase (PRPP-forming) PhnN n=1 Tax=Roseobacter ponti TaxID=1891787 RepID=UPI00248384C5|nr:phosphonate metabolism protein/1,5-bisphosphokinase (PRPP-forming) PhnN [Roseobacter ponti]